MQFLSSANNNRSLKAIFFDLDGTLLNSAPDLATAVNNMLHHFNLEHVSLELICKWIGNGAPKLIERVLDHQQKSMVYLPTHQNALAQFYAQYDKVQGQYSTLYDGVIDTLTVLKSIGLSMAVITNKPSQFTPNVLKAHGLTEFFELVLSGDSLAQKKPHPLPIEHALAHFNLAKHNVIMVGDSTSDISAANNAGIASICVTYGYNHGENPLDLAANAHIHRFSQLLD
ncbi:phosphoglycolate phosphatase [Paraglaciecola aquimarina]|uniref:phosphoglycolate phosphatase n=1 Tax=Paraglaciecola algarum TaxID=3050085 RepID=A0ABS9DDG8_9ALTE|nr:phosphoglycolate phosphatase [Paraglaciecola sp. G1-23]MCF2950047.1 phosphoglycolate phosphatase [Paraglaciecola sp. G1-23]